MKTLTTLFVCLGIVGLRASDEFPIDVVAHARNARQVAVGKVLEVQPRFAVNEFGDRLIVSDVHIQVEETLKGEGSSVLTVEVEGGTIGTLTLTVSDMPVLRPGERAVFFVNRGPNGNVLYQRGRGVLELDANNRAARVGMSLAQLRTAVKSAPGQAR